MMRLSVSNLAWPESETDWCLSQLQANGIEGVEVAPLKVFTSWEAITETAISDAKHRFDRYDLEVSSFQAITYGVQDITLLGNAEKQQNLLNHLTRVAELLKKLGGKVAVFGSPGLRQDEGFDPTLLAQLLYKTNDIFKDKGVKFALETVPGYYGCQILNTLSATDAFLDSHKMSYVVRHFDTGCQSLSGDLENTAQCKAFLAKSAHLHISEKDLKDFSNPSSYNISAALLIKDHYKGGWCVLEMGDKQFSRKTFLSSIKNFASLFTDSES